MCRPGTKLGCRHKPERTPSGEMQPMSSSCPPPTPPLPSKLKQPCSKTVAALSIKPNPRPLAPCTIPVNLSPLQPPATPCPKRRQASTPFTVAPLKGPASLYRSQCQAHQRRHTFLSNTNHRVHTSSINRRRTPPRPLHSAKSPKCHQNEQSRINNPAVNIYATRALAFYFQKWYFCINERPC